MLLNYNLFQKFHAAEPRLHDPRTQVVAKRDVLPRIRSPLFVLANFATGNVGGFLLEGFSACCSCDLYDNFVAFFVENFCDSMILKKKSLHVHVITCK